jgi:hypothetical protein
VISSFLIQDIFLQFLLIEFQNLILDLKELLSSGEPDAKISLWFLIYLEALYFMFKVIIIIDRIRKAKSILVAYLSETLL